MKGEVPIDPTTEEKLNLTLRDVENILHTAEKCDVTEEKIIDTKTAVENSLGIITSLENVVSKYMIISQ